MNEALAVLWKERDLFLNGLLTTILLVAMALAVAFAGGAILAVAMRARSKSVRGVTQGFNDLLRSIPFLLLAYLVYYALPQAGIRLPAFWAGAVALSIYNVAYFGEIFRSAWANLPLEYVETAKAFGMTHSTVFRRIVVPQVLLTSAPVLGSQTIIMIKDTAFLLIITVQDLTFAANFVNANYFAPFAPFALALIIYWGLCLIVESLTGLTTAAANRRRHA